MSGIAELQHRANIRHLIAEDLFECRQESLGCGLLLGDCCCERGVHRHAKPCLPLPRSFVPKRALEDWLKRRCKV